MDSFWRAFQAQMQGFNEICGVAFRRLSEVQAEACAEALRDGLSLWAALGNLDSGAVLGGWPGMVRSAQGRAAETQRNSLDIWLSAQQATVALLNETAPSGGAPGPWAGTPGRFVERRVSARIIHFPDRRALVTKAVSGSASAASRTMTRAADARR
jgi:hypothetical protein